MNALTSLMWLLLQGTASLAVAWGEAHYHRIAGHETAEAEFSCWEKRFYPPALPSASVNMNQGEVQSTYICLYVYTVGTTEA